MRLWEIMSEAVETVKPEAPAEAAYERMRKSGVHHLVVVEAGRVLGVISERDLGGRRGPSVRRDRTVWDLMTAPAICASPDTTIQQAANLLRGRSIGCLPVLDGVKVVGVVTITDVLRFVERGVQRPLTGGPRWAERFEPQARGVSIHRVSPRPVGTVGRYPGLGGRATAKRRGSSRGAVRG